MSGEVVEVAGIGIRAYSGGPTGNPSAESLSKVDEFFNSEELMRLAEFFDRMQKRGKSELPVTTA